MKKRGDVESFELPEDALEQAGRPERSSHDLGLERVIVTRRATLPGLEAWEANDSTRLWSVFHTTYAFCAPRAIKQDAAPRWKYRRRHYEMDLSSVRLLEPDESHVAVRNPQTDFAVLMLDASLVFDPEGNGPVHFQTGQIEDGHAARALLDLCSIVHSAEDDLEVEGRWCELRMRLVERGGTRPTRSAPVCPRGVHRARDYLHANFASPMSLRELAEVAELSQFHLDRSFREFLGVPLHRYLVKIRLAHAQKLLKSGQRLKAVAAQTGFCDAPHLSRAFVAHFGITPGTYAATGRGRLAR